MVASAHKVLILQGGRTERKDNSHEFMIRDIKLEQQDFDIKKLSLTNNIQTDITNLDNLELIIVNAHGNPWANSGEYSILFGDRNYDLSLASSWKYEKLETLFSAIGRNLNKPITICVFACYAGAGCTNKIMEKLPAGSLVGFYNPKDKLGRMEVSQWQIHKLLDMWRAKDTLETMLWQITSHCQCFIAYKHPVVKSFRQIELPTNNFNDSFNYRTITSESALEKIRQISLARYNGFLRDNTSDGRRLEAVNIDVAVHISHYKDLWFIQMVVPIAGNDSAAIQYLRTVTPELRNHKMSFAGIPLNNLEGYFKAWEDPVYKQLTRIFNPIGPYNLLHLSTSIPFIPTPKHRKQEKTSQSENVNQDPRTMEWLCCLTNLCSTGNK